MTIPTKEQIEILKEKWNNLTNASIETNLYWIITEWEKMKDVDARVEKLYKLGTQDWEDFYKAINSSK